MQMNYNKKRKLNKLKTCLLLLMMVLFAGAAQAQRETLPQVTMQDGTTMMDVGDNCRFYDSHGKSHETDPTNNINYWDRWYRHNENFTYTFKANDPDAYIKVEFNMFEAYAWSNTATNNCVSIGQWALRINDDELKVYQGENVNGTLIQQFTGNAKASFAVIGKGALTFHFKSNDVFREEGWEATVTCVNALTPQPPFIQKANCDDHIVLYSTMLNSQIYYTTNANDPDPFDPLSEDDLYQNPIEWPAGSDLTVKAVSVVNGVPSSIASATFYDQTTTGQNAHESDRTPDITTDDYKPGIERIANQNRMKITCPEVPSNLNETFVVVYTTNGADPELNGGTGHNKVYFVSTDHQVYNDGVNVLNGETTYEFDWTTPNVTFKAKVFGVSCVNLESQMNTCSFGDVYVPDPTITFEDVTSGGNTTGTATITSTLAGQDVVIYYTLDGSEPTTSSAHGNSPLEVADIAPGTTVKAYATVSGTGFQQSQTISVIYIPGGQGSGGGVYGGVVILNDREEHTWSYYSDKDQPVHSLKPADVKITYYGYGENTMTSTNTDSNPDNDDFDADVEDDQVAVNVGESANQFIYLKTLENDNPEGSSGNSQSYSYNMIPNPFQVRPMYEEEAPSGPTLDVTIGSGTSSTSSYLPTYTFNRYSFSEQIYTAAEIGSAGTIRTISFRVSSNATSRNVAIYLKHTTKTSFADNTDWESMSNSNLVFNGTVTFTSGWTDITLDTPFEYNGTSNLIVAVDDNNYDYTYNAMQCYTYNAGSNSNRSIYVTSDNTNYNPSTTTYTGTRGNYCDQIKLSSNGSSSSSNNYRGFYAWRVKSLSNGLTIINANGDEIEEDGIVYADEKITFSTANAKDNEVEFEALWAQAYVVTSNTTTGMNSSVGYERNFMVLTSGSNITPAQSSSYAYTLSSIYPNGTTDGTTPATGIGSTTLRGGNVTTSYYINNGYYTQGYYYREFTLSNALKIENITWNGTGTNNNNTNRTIVTTNGNNLVIGKGVEGDLYMIRGFKVSTSAQGTVNSTVRIESGHYQNLYLLTDGIECVRSGNSYSAGREFSSTATVKCVLGCDYDRASADGNDNLSIAANADNGEIYGAGYAWFTSSSNKDNLTFDWTVKSGKFQEGILGSADGGNQSIYLGSSQGDNELRYVGKRRMTIEGGSLASVAGGMNSSSNSSYNNTYTTQTAKDNVVIRVKGGTIRGSIYGAAAFAGAAGGRTFVITKGTINGWIAGGCNGTRNTGGELFGSTYVYVGGKVSVVQSTDDPYIGGTNSTYGTNGAYGGNIFGAGCGIKPTNYDANNPGASLNTLTVGKVYGSKVVIADEATIGRDVYGGGNFGLVADASFGSNADKTANIYILGGTIKGKVFGGSNNQKGETVNIYVKGGKVQGRTKANGDDDDVEGSVYGGSNVWGTINEDATIDMSGGTVTNIFGGGYGESTTMAKNTVITVSGGTINNNVYGGGEEGTVTNNTNVTFSGGTVKNVFGAGKGKAAQGTTPAVHANIDGNTTVTVSGGTVSESVYGGGENGTVAYADGGATSTHTSTVTVSGGKVTADVFGGGKMGTTQGNTHVTVSGGSVKNVFGGALGVHDEVFVAGTHIVNIIGQANVLGSVYGGSRNADDALKLTGNTGSETDFSSMINISGGVIKEHVYAAGYYGKTYGSVYASIGLNAINNNPYTHVTSGVEYDKDKITIGGSVWAGGDWGTFSGNFGGSTVMGNSNIYLDGYGYETTSTSTSAANYMNIGLSVLGCGTSCDAGKVERTLVMRNYGTDIANTGSDAGINPVKDVTRELKSIQRFKHVIFDNTHLSFEGQGKLNDLNQTERYSLYAINEDAVVGENTRKAAVYVTNGTTLVMNAPGSQLKSFHSSQCDNVYAATPSFTTVYYDSYTGTGAAKLSNVPNKIRVNGGSFIELKYETVVNGATKQYYGELEGYCYMMNTDDSNDATCAYARPKWGTGAPFSQGNATYNHQADGGFVSYDWHYNTFDAGGNKVAASTGSGVQIDYENHAPARNDTEYFRVWRYSGNNHTVDGILLAQKVSTEGAADYYTCDVTIELPAWQGNAGSYYRFDRVGDDGSYNYLVDWGIDVMTGNAAYYNKPANGSDPNPATGDYWMYFSEDIDNDPETETPGIASGNAVTAAGVKPGKDFIDENPNVNFGLVAIPGQAITPLTGTNANGLIICDNADSYLAGLEKPFACSDFNKNPQITFRLTYSNALSSNMSYDPILIPLVQCDKDGNVTDYVTVRLTVNTSTTITSGFSTKVYARMNGGQNPNKKSYVTIQLPSYPVATSGEMSQFTVKSVDFVPGDWYGSGTGTVAYNAHGSNDFDFNSFGLTLEAYLTPDNIDDWRDKQPEVDGAPGNGTTLNQDIAKAGGRSDLALAVNLYYNEQNTFSGESTKMGTVTFHVKLDNYGGNDSHIGEFDVTVEVWRIGESQNYFVDGIHGTDNTEIGRGLYPDFAAKSVNYVLNRLGFLPGDNIFIVNEVDINKAVKFNGEKFQNEINIWRYPGKHELKTSAGIEGNSENNAYTGVLFDITKGSLTVNGTKIDGMYAEAIKPEGSHNKRIYPVQNGCNFDGESQKPLINVNKGTTLELTNASQLLYNYNAGTPASKAEAVPGEGGAVKVTNGSVLKMNAGSVITGNICENGGGVYMDGSMIVSDSVRVYDNKHGVAEDARQDNIWLTKGTNQDYKVVQIGIAGNNSYTELSAKHFENGQDSKLGIDKKVGGDAVTDEYGFLPVVFAEDGNIEYLDAPYAEPQVLIVHDQNKYKLERGYDDNYLYWIDTWVTYQTHQPTASAEDGGVAWAGVDNITTPNQLAWLISLVNGENECTADDFANKTIIIKNDLDLSEHIWVPIGQGDNVFSGNFEGNGHVIEGLYCKLVKTDMGMFGKTQGANIQNVIVNGDFEASASHMGSIAGTMIGGSLSNVEGSGVVSGTNSSTRNVGGLVGQVVAPETGAKPVIKSAFAVNTLNGGSNAVVGGLVGTNGGNLYNSFSNVTLGSDNSATTIGGLVGVNGEGCTIENCYNATETTNQFAATNNGTIQYCYGKTATYCGGTQPAGSGTYSAPVDRKAIGYMYADNTVDAENDYVASEISYTAVIEGVEKNVGHITEWPGLLSTLNQWVAAHSGYTKWMRPTTSGINDDLPVLIYTTGNCMASFEGDKFIKYSNDLDALLAECNAKVVETETPDPDDPEQMITTTNDVKSSLFLYSNATEVANVPATMPASANGKEDETEMKVEVFINEDAVLLQAEDAEDFTATVGVTFDNSDHGQNAYDYYGNNLKYDWHFMSTPLADASTGATYTNGTFNNSSAPNISGMVNGYFPNDLGLTTPAPEGSVMWDFYTYYEPEYHWINLKRGPGNHWHTDNPNGIDYEENDNTETGAKFIPGKGYMMAISQDSYMSNSGVLNNGNVTITLTNGEPQSLQYNKGWNLVGNPYQAYLDLKAVRTGVDASYYIYDAESGDYVPYAVGASQNTVTPSRYIHPHQGFFMYSAADNNEFSFTQSMATTEKEDGSYFRGDEQINYPLVNLFARSQAGNNDLAIIELNRPEIGGATKMSFMTNANFELSAYLDGQDYGLLFTPEGTEKVPVHFTTQEDGTYTLTWDTQNGVFTSLLLVDNMTGTITDMLRADHYTFDAKTSDYASRFYLTYACTGVEEVNEGDGSFAFFDGSEWIVNGKGQLDVIDVTGRVLFSKRIANEQNRVNLNNVAPGVYMMRVSDGKDTMVQKIVVR